MDNKITSMWRLGLIFAATQNQSVIWNINSQSNQLNAVLSSLYIHHCDERQSAVGGRKWNEPSINKIHLSSCFCRKCKMSKCKNPVIIMCRIKHIVIDRVARPHSQKKVRFYSGRWDFCINIQKLSEIWCRKGNRLSVIKEIVTNEFSFWLSRNWKTKQILKLYLFCVRLLKGKAKKKKKKTWIHKKPLSLFRWF